MKEPLAQAGERFVTTQKASELTGTHVTTMKRWASRMYASAADGPIRREQRVTGGYRYLIDSTYLKEHYKPLRRKSAHSADDVALLQEKLALKEEVIEQQRVLIEQQRQVIEILKNRREAVA